MYKKSEKINKNAQATMEFVFVFLVLIAMLFVLIELALYWKARYSVETITNEIMANAQLAPLPDNDLSCPAAERALEVLILKGGGLFMLDSPVFSTTNDDGKYTYTSSDTVKGGPRLTLEVNCTNAKNSILEISLKYRYSGIMLYTGGTDIFSSTNFSGQKF